METLLLSAVTLSATLALFVTLYKLVRHETLSGERVMLVGLRNGIDSVADWLGGRLGQVTIPTHFGLFHRRSEGHPAVAAAIRQATRVPLTVTHTDNHLSKMRDHKSDTALSPAQGRKLRHQKLEERF